MKGRYVTWFRKVGDLPHVTNLKAKLETRVEHCGGCPPP